MRDTYAARVQPSIRHHTGLLSWDVHTAIVVADGHIVAAMRDDAPDTLWIADGTPIWYVSPAVFVEVFSYRRLSNA